MKTLIWRVALIGSLAAALVLSICVEDAAAQVQAPPAGATANIRDAAGHPVASAEFREGHGEVLITLTFATPPALSGSHGLRIHQVGRCDPPDFLTAGGGFNPTGKQHGRQNPNGPQVGDLPNVNFATGLTSYNTTAVGATLGSGPNSLLGGNGTSVIVYANEDDQLTDPDGKAGARVACGVISAAAAAFPGSQLLQTGTPGGTPAIIVGLVGLGLIGFGFGMRRPKPKVKANDVAS